MIYRSATTLLALVAATAALRGQTPDPKSEFTSAVGQFSLALEGAFGDEGTRVRSSLDAMSRTLNAWDSVLRQYESALAADLRTADPALATRLHMALAGLYFDRTRTADGLR